MQPYRNAHGITLFRWHRRHWVLSDLGGDQRDFEERRWLYAVEASGDLPARNGWKRRAGEGPAPNVSDTPAAQKSAPAPKGENRLRIRYAAAAGWERKSTEQLFKKAQSATQTEREALRQATAAHQARARRFAAEKEWVKPFLVASDAPAAPEIVQMDVLGERILIKRSSLMLCQQTMLARQFDPEAWVQQQAGGGLAAGDEESDSDEEDADVVVIQQPKFCFKLMVDQLRLAAMVVPAGDAPPAPVVPKHERKAFDTLVNYYFPGEEDFIKRGSVVQRPLGTSLHEARVASLRSAKTHYVCSKCENFLCASLTPTPIYLRDSLVHVWAAQARNGKSSPSSTAGISAKG